MAGLLLGWLPGAPSANAQAPPVLPTPIASDADWLTSVNYYRAMAGLGPVTEDPAFSHGNVLHARYLWENGLGLQHDEDPSLPHYTPEGDAAGNASNLSAADAQAPDRAFVESWMSIPFHGVGIIDPRLIVSGFGRYRDYGGLDVVRGIDHDRPVSADPVVFPGMGTTTYLHQLGGEYPEPLTGCPGYTRPAGATLLAQFPQSGALRSASLHRNGVAVEVCAFDGATYRHPGPAEQSLGRSILAGRNAVALIPRQPLTGATYDVEVVTDTGTASWSFRASRGLLQSFIAATSSDFLGRELGLDEELARTAEAASIGRAEALRRLVTSDEWLGAVVDRFYLDTLGRVADTEGRAYWISRLRDGETVAAVAAQFYASDEYHARAGGTAGWVSALYRALVGRDPDPNGAAFWEAEAARAGRAAVAEAFYGSLESRGARVAALYQALLGRNGDPAGRAHWAEVVGSDGDLVLATFLASSDEYVLRAAGRYP